jgi:hypothetical protein
MNNKLATLIVTFYVVFTFTAGASAARVRWEVAAGGNGHWYEALTGPEIEPGVPSFITWTSAQLDAVARGGYLATITSAAENDFVFNLIDSPLYWATNTSGVYFGPWLGGLQAPGTRDPAANWSWVTGEPFAYTNWHSGEPNDEFGRVNEDRLMFLAVPGITGTRSPFWNDEIGVRRNVVSYVVEYVPEPASFVMFATAAGFVGAVVRRGRNK